MTGSEIWEECTEVSSLKTVVKKLFAKTRTSSPNVIQGYGNKKELDFESP
jgi:hypothetical protein